MKLNDTIYVIICDKTYNEYFNDLYMKQYKAVECYITGITSYISKIDGMTNQPLETMYTVEYMRNGQRCSFNTTDIDQTAVDDTYFENKEDAEDALNRRIALEFDRLKEAKLFFENAYQSYKEMQKI